MYETMVTVLSYVIPGAIAVAAVLLIIIPRIRSRNNK